MKYGELSWYTHAVGLTGFDLKADTYPVLQATGSSLRRDAPPTLPTVVTRPSGSRGKQREEKKSRWLIMPGRLEGWGPMKRWGDCSEN